MKPSNLNIEVRELPEPDPAWDYAFVWTFLLKFDRKLALMLSDLADQEQATPEKTRQLQANLQLMGRTLLEAAQLLGGTDHKEP